MTAGMGTSGGSRAGEPYRLAAHDSPTSPRHMQSSQGSGMGQTPVSGHGMGHGPVGSGMGGHGGQSPGQHASRRNLQVDFSSSRTGRSPSGSPDRGVTPTSPYSLPQIAPMPSSKLCPVCTTTELSNPPAVPNYNTCTQCKATVCNQCGFNPNPHLTEVSHFHKAVPWWSIFCIVCVCEISAVTCLHMAGSCFGQIRCLQKSSEQFNVDVLKLIVKLMERQLNT